MPLRSCQAWNDQTDIEEASSLQPLTHWPWTAVCQLLPSSHLTATPVHLFSLSNPSCRPAAALQVPTHLLSLTDRHHTNKLPICGLSSVSQTPLPCFRLPITPNWFSFSFTFSANLYCLLSIQLFISNPTHAVHPEFQLRPSGRWYRVPLSSHHHFKYSCVPLSLKAL